MYLLNCYNVTEDEWLYADDEVPFAHTEDIEDREEAEKRYEELKAEFPYVQLVED